jgi:hypothetical protein
MIAFTLQRFLLVGVDCAGSDVVLVGAMVVTARVCGVCCAGW